MVKLLEKRLMIIKQIQENQEKQEKKDILNSFYALFDDRERFLDAFESKIFPIKIKAQVI